MRSISLAALLAGASAVFALTPAMLVEAQPQPAQPQQAQHAAPQRPAPYEVWSPKPDWPDGWKAPMKPIWRLKDILAKHAGQSDWVEYIVQDRDSVAKYISMGPGQKTKTMMYADNRVFWVVQDGQIRFNIEGQPPFVASKGWLVQVPFRTWFSLETVGDKPSLRFEVKAMGEEPVYPADETAPTPIAGRTYVKATTMGHGAYDKVNKPFLDFQKDVVEANGHGGAFVADDHTFANIIRGHGAPPPPPTNFGHFHVYFNEFWFILEGKIDYQIEGVPFFTAEQGDIVYAPLGRWHRASFGGDGMSTRLAINPRPDGMHNFQPKD